MVYIKNVVGIILVASATAEEINFIYNINDNIIMLSRIIAGIYVILLTLFPWSARINANYQSHLFFQVGEFRITDNIVNAIKDNDTKAIEGMLSESTKSKLTNPTNRINDFFESFDGEITSYQYSPVGADKIRDLEHYHFKSWEINVQTSKTNYRIQVYWVVKDGYHPENVNLKNLSIFDSSGSMIYEMIPKVL